MATASTSVLTCSLMLTNWLGKSAPSVLANSAFTLIVPVTGSIALSVVLTLPSASWLRRSRSQACTVNGSVPLSLRAICGRLASGRANTTLIGCVCVMVTMPVASPARTKLPSSTVFRPSRPLIGAVILVYESSSLALSTCACVVCTVALSCCTSATCVSTCCLAMESLASRSL